MIKLDSINDDPPNYNESVKDQIRSEKVKVIGLFVISYLLVAIALIIASVSFYKSNNHESSENLSVITGKLISIEKRLNNTTIDKKIIISDICLDYNKWDSTCKYSTNDGKPEFDKLCMCLNSCSPSIHQKNTTSGAKIKLSVSCFDTIFSQFVLSFKLSGVLISVYSVYQPSGNIASRTIEYNYNSDYNGRFLIVMDSSRNTNNITYWKELYVNVEI